MPRPTVLVFSRPSARSMTLVLLALGFCSQPGPATRYVATTGSDAANDCSNSGSPCATIQVAVDAAAAGEDIRVAEGTYSGSQTVVVERWGTNHNYRQVVFIAKALTVRGGYHPSDWTTSDPGFYITEISAEADGRPVTVVDTLHELVVLDGLLLTDGDSTGLGNPAGLVNHVCRSRGDEDCGGGLYVYRSAIHLLNSEVRGNVASTVAGDGGGIYLWEALESTIENTKIDDNSAPYGGGGIYVTQQDFPLTIRGTRFLGNTSERGGGADLAANISALVRFQDCAFVENAAVDGKGGGLYALLAADGLVLELERVVVDDNQAWEQGKGVYLDAAGSYTPEANLVNVLFSTNGSVDGAPAATEDAVLAVAPLYTSLKATLAHVTAGPNQAPTFLYARPSTNDGRPVEVTAANVLLSGFQNGFAAEEIADSDATIEHTNTLFYNVVNQHLTVGGTPTFTSVNPVLGDPMLDVGYRLQVGSAAIDTGVDVGILDDIDGDTRPYGAGFDIGADEYSVLFVDGFESGDTSAWSTTVP